MNHVTRISGIIFGTTMIALSVTIVAEILLRKFFSFSLGGVDELGGYAVAIVAPSSASRHRSNTGASPGGSGHRRLSRCRLSGVRACFHAS